MKIILIHIRKAKNNQEALLTLPGEKSIHFHE